MLPSRSRSPRRAQAHSKSVRSVRSVRSRGPRRSGTSVARVRRVPQPLELNDWIDKTHSAHLRAQDVMRLRKGQTLRLTFLDRNVADLVLSARTGRPVPGKRYTAKRFLRQAQQGVFTADGTGGLTGTMHWTNHWPPGSLQPFTFEPLDARRGLWHPGNSVRTKQSRVGWRGPAVLTSKLGELPDMVVKR